MSDSSMDLLRWGILILALFILTVENAVLAMPTVDWARRCEGVCCYGFSIEPLRPVDVAKALSL
ncbi:hypothetical protein N9O61_03755 [Octadecabacter sp.]|nr:hypothetical protein [Octadecabacter sp.]